jgi:methanogenic corrinoid protein MtbC1
MAEEPRYLIRAVVRQTGIPAATLRSWERRYGFPAPGRTATERRLYSPADIEAIRWVKAQLAQGTPIGQALQWYRSGETAPSHEQGSASFAQPQEATGDLDALVRRILKAVADYDESGLDAALSSAFALHPPDTVLIDVIATVLHQIGERWAQGEIDVTAEHFASNILRGRLLNLLWQQPALSRAPSVAMACVAGEQHDIGLLMLAVFLRWTGLQPLYLGANVPLADLLTCIRETGVGALCLSADTTDAGPALAEVTAEVARAYPDLAIFAGGAACAGASLGPRVAILGDELRTAAQSIARAVRFGDVDPPTSPSAAFV